MTDPQFPNYQNPATLTVTEQPGTIPHGIPLADPKYHKPLFKLAKLMMKPKVKHGLPKVKAGRKGRKKVAFH